MRLAKRLSDSSLGGKVFFANSGAEAIECALKLARRHRAGGDIVVLKGGFHGRTLLALTLTSKARPYKAGLGPFAPEVYRVPFPNAYRGPSAGEALAAIRRAFLTVVAAEDVAAIVFEPVQGEGGFIPAPQEFV